MNIISAIKANTKDISEIAILIAFGKEAGILNKISMGVID